KKSKAKKHFDEPEINKPLHKKKKKDKKGRHTSREIEPDVKKHGFEKPTAPIVKEVKIPETISVSDLALKMSVKAVDVIKEMMKMGAMATINQVIDQETAALVVEEMGHKPVML